LTITDLIEPLSTLYFDGPREKNERKQRKSRERRNDIVKVGKKREGGLRAKRRPAPDQLFRGLLKILRMAGTIEKVWMT